MQQADSSSGTSGTIKMYAVDEVGEFKVDFDSPFNGNNKCNLSGNIPGLKFRRVFFSGWWGDVAICAMIIDNE